MVSLCIETAIVNVIRDCLHLVRVVIALSWKNTGFKLAYIHHLRFFAPG